VDEHVKKQRAHAMQMMADEKAQEYCKRFIGKTLSVLFESEHEGIADGLTNNYVRVYVDANSVLCGEIYNVSLEKVYKDGLWGKICK
jgi:threonylcarbamoyladenosine tRNA methylthiotransferase MtaB